MWGSAGASDMRLTFAAEVSSGSRLTEWITVSKNRPQGRVPWTSLQFAYLALVLNGLGVATLFANLLTGGGWAAVAVPVAVVCLILGFATGFQTRRMRIREAGQNRM